MTVLFTETYIFTRASAGAHVKGKYVAGPTSDIDIEANWQPLSGKELLNLSELQRTRRSIKIYSEEEIKGLNKVAKIPADIMTIEDGTKFEIQSVEYYKELNEHWKAMGVEINS